MRSRGRRWQVNQSGVLRGAFRRWLPAWVGVWVVVAVAAGQEGLVSEEDSLPEDEQIRPFDRVVFENASGRLEEVRCNVVDEMPNGVEIEKVNAEGRSLGRLVLRRDWIKEIVRRNPPENVYRLKERRLPYKDVSPTEKARAYLNLGIWCRTPHPALMGKAPAAEMATEHLLRAVRIDPSLKMAYPHLLDSIANLAAASQTTLDQEMEIYTLAERGGYEDPEIALRKGEIYVKLGLQERALQSFQKVLDWQGLNNASLLRRCRKQMTEIYLARDELDQALQLYSVSPDGDSDDSGFERAYLSARILLLQRDPRHFVPARELLAEALEIQPSFPGVQVQLAGLDLLENNVEGATTRLIENAPLAGNDPEYSLALALVYLEQHKFEEADEILTRTRPEVSSVADSMTNPSAILCQWHLVKGLLHDYRGQLADAETEYGTAWELSPEEPLSDLSVVAGLLLVRVRIHSGDTEAARQVLDGLARRRPDDPGVLAAYARYRSDLERAVGNSQEALFLLSLADSLRSSGEDPYFDWKYGTLLLHEGKLESAYTHLAQAEASGTERPETFCSLGYYYYKRGEMEAAEKSFRKVLALTSKPPPGLLPEGESLFTELRRYAEQGLSRVLDVRRLEVWRDGFERDDGEDIHRGWLKVDNFGVRISLDAGKVIFSGQQRNRVDGVTKLYREVEAADVERVSARLRVASGTDHAVRLGLRIETDAGDSGAGIVFVRDFDGKLRLSVKSQRGYWQDVKPTTETNPISGKLVYSEITEWPSDGLFHTLTVRRADSANGGKGFDLLFDDKPVAFNVYVGALREAKTKRLIVGVSGQGDRLGGTCRFEVDDFRIHRLKLQEEERRRR